MRTTKGVTDADGGPRVVLVSSRPMFTRTFGKVLGVLRDELRIDAVASVSGLKEAPATLVMIDAGGVRAAALSERVVEACARVPATGVVAVLDEADDALTDAAMAAGARGVMIKAAPPGVLAEWLDALLDGEIVRPAPSVALDPDTLSEALRARLSARRQKLLRLQMGGTSITETARALGLTPAKVVTEMRAIMAIVRGGDPGN